MSNNTPQHTPLYQQHLEAGGKMVDFAGWEMPINYGSQVKEHHQVRTDAGMFDVSHMVVVDFTGKDCKAFLQYLLANNIDKLKQQGKALYSCMLNEDAGIIDDLIVYYLADDFYRMVINAATRENDLAWINKQAANFDLEIKERDDLAMIAAQGPNAREKLLATLDNASATQVSALNPFFGIQIDTIFYARTGYTGEDGFEIMLPNEQVAALWNTLLAAGIAPTGLGARDTLRLEAGMSLYGTDMDTTTSPLVSALKWTVALEPKERNFLGRSALEAEIEAKPATKMVGLVLEGKGVLRGHQQVITESGTGEITSGTYSPTLGVAIALARVPADTGDHCHVEIRNKQIPARVVKPPFVRNGKSCL
ncbi:MAG TPA: glycine cleavage system aminomethyltransferase GcvT [Leucothrix mucor]|uniref:Aminomethyltransferase n=1 Tax=Leucothrix mucor TaxID=45248 RepID=A0A7V2T4X4_LEUMU|nr:glycine cleavage system aminomethyltransferase GcvT [Leucothrix mucor]